MSSHTDRRAFVLGLSGVPWPLVDRWAGGGRLPNFERLLSEGAGGPLQSTTPPSGSLAWPSIATGVWPDKHGVYGTRSVTPAYGHRTNTSRDVAHPELWDVVSPSVVANVPMTYPTGDTDATVVAGPTTPERDEGFTSPPELAAEIERLLPDYEIDLPWEEYRGREDAFANALEDMLVVRRRLMDHLLDREDWRLFCFAYTAPDRLQHLVWGASTLLEHYRTLDAIVGKAMYAAERKDATLYVVSDHGFGPVDELVYVNRLLEREGYLVRREGRGIGLLDRLGLDGNRRFDRVGIRERTLAGYLPRPLLDAAEWMSGDRCRHDLDFERTTAFVHGPGNVYVNDTERFAEGAVDPGDVDRVKGELSEFLESVVDPVTGESPLRVWDGNTHFPSDDYAPDLVVHGRNGYAVRTSLTDEPFADAETVAGHHEREGVFLAWGDDVEVGATPADASVVDVAPTVLHGLGEPIPSRTDGRILEEIFDPDSAPARRAPTTAAYSTRGVDATDCAFEDAGDRLRGRGYR